MQSDKTYFVSDLHLFSSRSQEERFLDQIRSRAADAKAFVFGGDIFDFRWSQETSSRETLVRAEHWLRELVTECPECQFHFILGNHDHHPELVNSLELLNKKLDNFDWYPYYLRLGNSLFLHGDVIDKRSGAQRLVKRRESNRFHKPRGAVANQIYDWAVARQLHKPLVHLSRRKKTAARRLLAYLGEIGQGADTGIENVYFGHTHLEMTDYKFDGVTFHNSGAPIYGLRFRIVEVAKNDKDEMR
jgi:UDP-2,3-diacylglucosamine pyrophosphatase LpxH